MHNKSLDDELDKLKNLPKEFTSEKLDEMLKSQRLESNKSGIGFNASQTSSSGTKFYQKATKFR